MYQVTTSTARFFLPRDVRAIIWAYIETLVVSHRFRKGAECAFSKMRSQLGKSARLADSKVIVDAEIDDEKASFLVSVPRGDTNILLRVCPWAPIDYKLGAQPPTRRGPRVFTSSTEIICELTRIASVSSPAELYDGGLVVRHFLRCPCCRQTLVVNQTNFDDQAWNDIGSIPMSYHCKRCLDHKSCCVRDNSMDSLYEHLAMRNALSEGDAIDELLYIRDTIMANENTSRWSDIFQRNFLPQFPLRLRCLYSDAMWSMLWKIDVNRANNRYLFDGISLP